MDTLLLFQHTRHIRVTAHVRVHLFVAAVDHQRDRLAGSEAAWHPVAAEAGGDEDAVAHAAASSLLACEASATGAPSTSSLG